MKKLRRFIVIVLTAVITLTFAACSSFDYDKDDAIKNAKELIEVANTRDYEALYNKLSASMQSAMTAADLKKAWDEPMLAPAGAFIEYKSADTSGVVQNGVKYITVVVTCKYENSTLIYTISFTTDMELAGLYLKPGL